MSRDVQVVWGKGGRPLPKRWGPWPGADSRIDREKKPFHLTAALRRVIEDIVARTPAFSHIDMSQTMVGFTSAKTRSKYGLYASLTPLRFRDGTLYTTRRGKLYQIQRFLLDGREQLYVVAFCLPRFLTTTFEEKLVTIFHELFHIGPRFDGDVRRHDGRYQYHTHSKKEYDEQMGHYVRAYLRVHPDPGLFHFLHPTYPDLWNQHGGIYGHVIPRPKMLPVVA